MRRQIARAEAEDAQLKDALTDLLSAAMNVATASARIANGEVKAAAQQPIGQAKGRPVDPPVLMSRANHSALELAGASMSPDVCDMPSETVSEPPADASPAFVQIKPDRETVAPGMVTFHGGMSIPRVAPFIFGVSSEPEHPVDED